MAPRELAGPMTPVPHLHTPGGHPPLHLPCLPDSSPPCLPSPCLSILACLSPCLLSFLLLSFLFSLSICLSSSRLPLLFSASSPSFLHASLLTYPSTYLLPVPRVSLSSLSFPLLFATFAPRIVLCLDFYFASLFIK